VVDDIDPFEVLNVPVDADDSSGCAVCGAQPVQTYRFRRVDVFFGGPNDDRWDRCLCRTCALADARHELARSLALAWIVPVPVLGSLPSLWTNGRALRSAHAAALPISHARPPLDPGPPLARRWQAWLFGVIAVVLVLAIAIGSLQPTR
jgi:hypothetical protein